MVRISTFHAPDHAASAAGRASAHVSRKGLTGSLTEVSYFDQSDASGWQLLGCLGEMEKTHLHRFFSSRLVPFVPSVPSVSSVID